MPQELLDLISAILLQQQLDEHLNPDATVADKLPADGADLAISRVQKLGSQQGAQVDDDLLVRWHVPLGDGTEHLIGVEFLMEELLAGGVILVTRQQRVGFSLRHGDDSPSKSEVGRMEVASEGDGTGWDMDGLESPSGGWR